MQQKTHQKQRRDDTFSDINLVELVMQVTYNTKKRKKTKYESL